MLQSCRLDKGVDSKEFYRLSSLVLKNYKLNDTIVFKSNLNNYDTIKIVEIDTIDNSRPYNFLISREECIISIQVGVQYLPKKESYQGFLQSKSGKYDSIGNQNFIILHANYEAKNPKYDRYLYFKHSSGNISLTKDIDTIKSDMYIKANDITELYWSKERGLTGYKTNLDEIFTIINRTPSNQKVKK